MIHFFCGSCQQLHFHQTASGTDWEDFCGILRGIYHKDDLYKQQQGWEETKAVKKEMLKNQLNRFTIWI
jgi:hypothetical protein